MDLTQTPMQPMYYPNPNFYQLNRYPAMVSPGLPKAALAMPGSDQFERVAFARVLPLGKDSYTVDAEISTTGKIYQKGLNGINVLGQLDPEGNFRLINGISGNVFQDNRLIIQGYQNEQSPFATALKTAQQQRALVGSEIPLLRKNLAPWGINGQGIQVGVLDPQQKDKKTNQWKPSDHTKLVTQLIQDPVWGVAPGAMVKDLGEQWEMNSELTSDDYQVYSNMVTGDFARLFNNMAGQLQKLATNRDPSLRVLNITAGNTRTEKAKDVWNKLQTLDDNNYYKYPAIRAAVMGPALYGTRKQQFQAVMNSVDNLLDHSPVVQMAQRQYVDMTHLAAKSGMILVAAAANEGDPIPFDLPIRPGNTLNEYAKSPYVITVAAANTNQMPGNRVAYGIAPFSSRGDGVQWNPTIAAPGAEMGVSFSAGAMGHNNVVAGTSFSTPFTCGVIAMMLQRNPYLTFTQVRDRLQSTATVLPGYSPAEQGAGVINAERAILA